MRNKEKLNILQVFGRLSGELIRILHCHAVQLDITDLTQILSGINVKTDINRLIIML